MYKNFESSNLAKEALDGSEKFWAQAEILKQEDRHHMFVIFVDKYL